MKNKYRVVRDSFAGYEAQIKYWWFPFVWFQLGAINTNSTVERAIKFIRLHKMKEDMKNDKTVYYQE